MVHRWGRSSTWLLRNGLPRGTANMIIRLWMGMVSFIQSIHCEKATARLSEMVRQDLVAFNRRTGVPPVRYLTLS